MGLEELTWRRVREAAEAGDELAGEGTQGHTPGGFAAVDPRSGEPTLFNESRAHRPHDYDGASGAAGREAERPRPAAACPICAGKTTPILDRAELSDGFTFINTNLFPVAAPGFPAPGLHLVQWTSSVHTTDWPDLSPADRHIVLDRLAEAERLLLELPGFPAPVSERAVSIIKNVGRSVGGSLSHGHQQMLLSAVAPRRVAEHRRFVAARGEPYARFMRRENPAELTVAELETGRLVVPYFMRRPYDMQYLIADDDAVGLWQLGAEQRRDLAAALAAGMELLDRVLGDLGRERAYNIVFHTGTAGGTYLEFRPFSQSEGGFEKMGLSACQGSPRQAARAYRSHVSSIGSFFR
jgi:galactose-1-phosphate uridylyltransferase